MCPRRYFLEGAQELGRVSSLFLVGEYYLIPLILMRDKEKDTTKYAELKHRILQETTSKALSCILCL